MVLEFFRGEGEDRLEHVEDRILDMLADCRHAFDLAMSALVGGADPSVVGPDLRTTDHRVNQTEQEVRRDLVLHASVHGAIDIPALLVYMSVVKDVERVGDYCKNIYDLSAEGVNLVDAEDRDVLLEHRDRVSEMITRAGRIFRSGDQEAARTFLEEGDGLLDRYDRAVAAYLLSDQSAREAVPRTLLYRHLKRVVAHLMNLVSAVVMPVDRLDYYDEEPEDRA